MGDRSVALPALVGATPKALAGLVMCFVIMLAALGISPMANAQSTYGDSSYGVET